MDAIKTIQFDDGFSLEIIPDDSPESPREWDNLGTMVCFHKNYDLGDKHDYRHEDYTGWGVMQEAIVANNPDCIIFPLFLYDHSGLRIKIGSFQGLLSQGHAEFDSFQIGFIFVSREKINEEHFARLGGRTDERIEEQLRGEVETYDQYLRGDVYGFVLRRPNCDSCDGPGEQEDSCWGFYGPDPVENGMADNLDTKYREQLERA